MTVATHNSDEARVIDAGWRVVTADGVTLGIVDGVNPYQLIVNSTIPESDLLFVPTDAVDEVESDIVYLNVAYADVSRQGWELMAMVYDLPIDEGASHEPEDGLEHSQQHRLKAKVFSAIGGVLLISATVLLVAAMVIGRSDLVLVSSPLAIAGMAAFGTGAVIER